MPERNLSEADVQDMDVEKKIPDIERRKGDRRKAINTTIDPKHERRMFDRRKLLN